MKTLGKAMVALGILALGVGTARADGTTHRRAVAPQPPTTAAKLPRLKLPVPSARPAGKMPRLEAPLPEPVLASSAWQDLTIPPEALAAETRALVALLRAGRAPNLPSTHQTRPVPRRDAPERVRRAQPAPKKSTAKKRRDKKSKKSAPATPARKK